MLKPGQNHVRNFSQQFLINAPQENHHYNYYSNGNSNGNYTNQQLWSYIFRLQSRVLDEVEFSENQRRYLKLEIKKQNIMIKNLMQEKIQSDSYKSYNSLTNYMDLEAHEILDLMKNAKDYKSSLQLKKKLEENEQENREKIQKLLTEKQELEDENYLLRTEIETTKNESFYCRLLLRPV